MKKTKDIRLPKARIAHRQNGVGAPLAALRRQLVKLRPGRSELLASSIAGGILVATGLMLAGFGAANQEGLAEKYTTPIAKEAKAEGLSNVCRSVRSSGEDCTDTWERAMAGADVDLDPWDGEQDWRDSRCSYTHICYDQSVALPAGAATADPKGLGKQ